MRRMTSALTALGVVVAGCGSAGSPPPATSTSTSAPGAPATSAAPGPSPGSGAAQGLPLACPFPAGPVGPLSTAQAADCVMARWATADGAGALSFATSADAVAALFAVEPRGTPAALGCGEVPGAAGAIRACTYALAEGGLATLRVTSTPERGAMVSSAAVS